jgi:hypothetical protein
VFLVNLPVCALLILATLKVVAESRDPNAKQLDFGGIVTFSFGLGLLIWALIDGNDDGWTSVGILVRLVAASRFFVGFVAVGPALSLHQGLSASRSFGRVPERIRRASSAGRPVPLWRQRGSCQRAFDSPSEVPNARCDVGAALASSDAFSWRCFPRT